MNARHTRLSAPFAALILACVAAEPAPRERDVWYAISDGEQRYGYLHVVARPSGEGGVEYAVASRMEVEFLGAPQAFSTSATLVAGADLAPLRLDAQGETMSGRTRVIGRSDGDSFVVETESGGETRTSAIPLAGPALLFDVALGDWIQRRRAEGRDGAPVQVRLLDASGNATLVSLRALEQRAGGSTWELRSEEAPAPDTLRFDHEGALVEQESRFPPLRVERAPADVAVAIEQRKIPDRELLFFPLDRELPPSRRLQSLTVELAWQGIPPGEFDLEDSRQRLESLAADGDRHKAVVALQRPGEITTDAALPLQARGFEAELGECNFIRPSHPRIAETAREIVSGETSALAAARALCAWVSDHVEDEMIAETLSGPEVLERRAGKCTEYTTLFASLARAAGIPTRVVLGQRLFGATWGGHMWNEVHVGEWIPVDASVDEVGGSLALLKLVHSDTVAGTQPLRWKLTESLQVSVVDFEATPAAAGGTGLEDGVYTDADHGFRLTLPSPEWRVESRTEHGSLTLRLRPPDPELGDGVQIHLVAFSIAAGTPPQAIIDARLEHQRSMVAELELLAEEPRRVAGADGRRLRFIAHPRAEVAVPTHVTEVLWIRGETGCLFNLIATEALHADFAETFEALLASFVFLEG